MTSQITSPSSDVKFGYNSINERLVKSDLSAGSSVLYLRGLNDYPLYEKQNSDGDGSFDKIYIYGPTGLIAVKRMEGTYFVLKDHLGSTRVIFDGATGDPVSYYDFTPYGSTMRVGGGIALKYQFTGQEFDEEFALHNFRARFYDSDLAMFYGVDPAGQNFSPYSYAGNNPVIYVDKDGRFFFIDDLIISGVSFITGYLSHGLTTGDFGWDAIAAGGIAAGSSLLAYYTGGGAAGLLFTEGYPGFAITSSVVGGVVGGTSGSIGIQLYFNQNVDLNQVWRSSLSGGVGGLAGGLAGQYVTSSPILTGMIGGSAGGLIGGGLEGAYQGAWWGGFGGALTYKAYEEYGNYVKNQIPEQKRVENCVDCNNALTELGYDEFAAFKQVTPEGKETFHLGTPLGRDKYGHHYILSKEGAGPISVLTGRQLALGIGTVARVGYSFPLQTMNGVIYQTFTGYGEYLILSMPKIPR